MSGPFIAAVIWALVGSATAMLPMRLQMVPGLALLITAPLLIVWIGVEYGWLWAGVGLLAFLSMFRRPLAYFAARAMGRPARRPGEGDMP